MGSEVLLAGESPWQSVLLLSVAGIVWTPAPSSPLARRRSRHFLSRGTVASPVRRRSRLLGDGRNNGPALLIQLNRRRVVGYGEANQEQATLLWMMREQSRAAQRRPCARGAEAGANDASPGGNSSPRLVGKSCTRSGAKCNQFAASASRRLGTRRDATRRDATRRDATRRDARALPPPEPLAAIASETPSRGPPPLVAPIERSEIEQAAAGRVFGNRC
jgi:hypothetical protein